MTTEMPPPPPRNPGPDSGDLDVSIQSADANPIEDDSSSAVTTSMPPPPSKILDSSKPSSAISTESNSSEASTPEQNPSNQTSAKSHGVAVPYKIPPWSEAPCHEFTMEVLKDGAVIDTLNVHEKGAYMFGRVDLCDFVLEHPTISRFHAVVQFNKDGDSYIYDLGSTHGTFINKNRVKPKVYVDLHVGDVIRFGQSSRLYIFQGPVDLMPKEADYNAIREAKIREKMRDREASLRRARNEAALADGVSWGMGEDAIEEDEEDVEEITWQTYKGQLTEKQEKTREKVIKRMQKIGHMKKEIDAIRAKDISQGGLTQGQQTQIARNEQRMSQLMEELENLEETLNESIRESLGARIGRSSRGKNKGATEEEDEPLSDDDEFFDRTKKKPSAQKTAETQSVETADTLLDKKETILKEIEEKNELLLSEKTKEESRTTVEPEAGDSLDAFMSGISTQIVLDKTVHIEKEIVSLQSELDRISYLLKIADPTGEASKRRKDPKPVKLEKPVAPIKKNPVPIESKEKENIEKKESTAAPVSTPELTNDDSSSKPTTTLYTIEKPQWLGAVEDKQQIKEPEKVKEDKLDAAVVESEPFVAYKDRKVALKTDGGVNLESASGLIIRKRKQIEKPEVVSSDSGDSSLKGAELVVEDAVALLLRHQKGIYAGVTEEETEERLEPEADKKRPKRVLGPEKPSFLDKKEETWVPPKGQSGDGRTSLNDRYGY